MVQPDNLLGIACDHAGFELKEHLKTVFGAQGFRFQDFGTHSADSVDYPDFAHALAKEIENGNLSRGILVCGSGVGVSITANKHPHVRCALCWKTDIAKLCRQHNDANVVALPARFLDKGEAEDIVNAFLSTAFEGGRHQKRVDKIDL